MRLIEMGTNSKPVNEDILKNVKNIKIKADGKIDVSTLPESMQGKYSRDVIEKHEVIKQIPVIIGNVVQTNPDGSIRTMAVTAIEERIVHKKGEIGQDIENSLATLSHVVKLLSETVEEQGKIIDELKKGKV